MVSRGLSGNVAAFANLLSLRVLSLDSCVALTGESLSGIALKLGISGTSCGS